MADNSAIEWTEATWNPVVGCSVISPGCTNCYAMKMAARLEAMGQPIYQGLTQQSKAGAVWTGRVELSNWGQVIKPLLWKKPRLIFVNSMSDLFHESLPEAAIDQVFAVMLLAPQHTYQVLTKRAARMQAYVTTPGRFGKVMGKVHEMIADGLGEPPFNFDWPANQIWLGVSAEDQARYDERKEHLRNTPAAVRWFSMEPLIGPINADYLGDWIVVGGESGPRARPMHPDWLCSIRDQCETAGVPFFFKQWGEYGLPFRTQLQPHPKVGNRVYQNGRYVDAHWFGDGVVSVRVGKKAAGRELYGRTYDAMPVR